jgi:hypothetical protein
VAEAGQHQRRRLADVDRLERDAERLGQPYGVATGTVAGGEAREREGEDVLARAVEPIHRPCRHDEDVGRVEATGQPQHDLRVPNRPQPLLQPGDLDVVRLVAVLSEAVHVGRDERESLHLASQPQIARRWVEHEVDGPEVP